MAKQQVRLAGEGNMTAPEIKELRNGMGLTQKELATLVGVSVKSVEAWERGSRTPSLPAQKIMQLLKDKWPAAVGGRNGAEAQFIGGFYEPENGILGKWMLVRGKVEIHFYYDGRKRRISSGLPAEPLKNFETRYPVYSAVSQNHMKYWIGQYTARRRQKELVEGLYSEAQRR